MNYNKNYAIFLFLLFQVPLCLKASESQAIHSLKDLGMEIIEAKRLRADLPPSNPRSEYLTCPVGATAAALTKRIPNPDLSDWEIVKPFVHNARTTLDYTKPEKELTFDDANCEVVDSI